jgi:hypothetical protein
MATALAAGSADGTPMADTCAVTDDGIVFAAVHDAITSFQGYGLERLSLSIIDTADALEISLSPIHPKPAMTLSIRDVHYFAMTRFPRDDIPFLDFEATTLIPGTSWPQNVPDLGHTVDGFPPLLWIRGRGPATFDVIAAIVTVLVQPR